LEARLRAAAPAGSDVEVTLFPSGALDVLIPVRDVIIMEGEADESEFGLTPDLRSDDCGFDSGHPLVFDTYDAAVEALLGLLTDPGRSALRDLGPT
jgi:hypothetical protein